MSAPEKKEIGFQLSYAAQVDNENQDQLQIHANAPTGASAAELADVIAVMRNAAWLERLACNERIKLRAELVDKARDQRVEEFKERGEAVDEEMIAEERAITNATLVKLQSKLDADRAIAEAFLKG